MKSLRETLAFAYRMHAGTTDMAGLPYINHPMWVMRHLPSWCSLEDQHIALCHDVVEDCQRRLCALFKVTARYAGDRMLNLEALFDGFASLGYSDYVVTGVRLLTRDAWPDLSYIEGIKNIIESRHFGAICVKYVDNLHNTDEKRVSRLSLPDRERWLRLRPRYEQSKRLLRAAFIGDHGLC